MAGGRRLLLLGLITSYTRASWLALPVAGLYYGVLRLRLTRWLLLGLAGAGIGAAVYLTAGERFMRYAPDFEKTIWHGGNFEPPGFDLTSSRMCRGWSGCTAG